MKIYLLKVLIFGLCYLLGSTVLTLLIPFYHGNEQLSTKYTQYAKFKNEVNTVFLGNSQINRHLNPAVFDQATGHTTNSFNLASDSTPFLELSYIVENVIQDLNAQNYVMIIFRSAPIRKENLYSVRTHYFHDLRRYKMALDLAKDNFTQLKYHTIAFFMNQGNSFLNLTNSTSEKTIKLASHAERGFLAYDKEAELLNEDFDRAADLQYFEVTLPKAKHHIYNTDTQVNTEEEVMIKECNRLYDLALAKDKQLYFLFMPNDHNYKVFDLPNTMYLGDGENFPQFYNPENYFNKTHLNDKGAIEFSKRLGNVYLKMQQ